MPRRAGFAEGVGWSFGIRRSPCSPLVTPPTPPCVRVRTRRFDGVKRHGPPGVRVRRAPCGLRSLGCRGSGLHPSPPDPKASSNWMFCRLVRMSVAVLLTLSVVRAFAGEPATMPSADFCAAVTGLADPLSPGLPDTAQTSRGKTDRLGRIPAGFTLPALDGSGLRDHAARSSGRVGLVSGSCSSGRGFCSTLPSDPASRRRPCASLILHRHQAG